MVPDLLPAPLPTDQVIRILPGRVAAGAPKIQSSPRAPSMVSQHWSISITTA